MGDIGEDQKEYEFEPFPDSAPAEPVYEPAPATEPTKEPVPA